MKYKITAAVLALVLALGAFAACGKEPAKPTEAQDSTSSEITEESTAEQEAEDIDYDDVYADVLDSFSRLIDSDETEFEGVAGVREALNAGKTVGYEIRDISGDGIPELIIGATVENAETEKKSTEIYAAYTCLNGKPFFAFEGSARSCYKLTANGELFYYGSEGAMSTSFGLFVPAQDGATLNCREFRFSKENESNPANCDYYYNTDGSYDTEKSEKISVTADEFNEMMLKLEAETTEEQLTALEWKLNEDPNAYDDETPARVTAAYVSESGAEIAGCREFMAEQTDYTVKVVLRTDKRITALKLLKLTYQNVDENGKVVFSTEELYKQDVFTPDEPLVAGISFPGAVPAYGISYIDADGTLKCLSFMMSGDDGSIILTEF